MNDDFMEKAMYQEINYYYKAGEISKQQAKSLKGQIGKQSSASVAKSLLASRKKHMERNQNR